jgi:hypothetical protein
VRAASSANATRVGSSLWLAGIGLLALVAGAAIYVVDRVPGHAVLIPFNVAAPAHVWFGVLGQWLPSFLHPFAFSLFSAAAAPRVTPRVTLVACAAWWAVNVVFELAQHPMIRAALFGLLPQPDAPPVPLSLLVNYLRRGTFDIGDLIAITLGALAAAAVLTLARIRGNHAN